MYMCNLQKSNQSYYNKINIFILLHMKYFHRQNIQLIDSLNNAEIKKIIITC